ncbi:hypothetical protein [uncultured Victivallis sp.]|nr:hypothetical protein [uncultured Victivallis sp.]
MAEWNAIPSLPPPRMVQLQLRNVEVAQGAMNICRALCRSHRVDSG